MVKLEKIGIETKAGLFFAASGVILAIVIGFFSGINLPVVLKRGIFTGFIFFGIGYGVFIVIKKYVPELFDIMESPAADDETADISIEEARHTAGVEEDEDTAKEGGDSGFTSLDQDHYERLSSTGADDLSGELNLQQGKMGKHIVMENQFNGYEPKVMADAVRTMLSRDKE